MNNSSTHGAAILASVCLLMLLILIVLLHTSKMKLLEYQVSRNYQAQQQARWHAQSRVEATMAALRVEPSWQGGLASAGLPLPSAAGEMEVQTWQRESGEHWLYTISAEGRSLDNTSRATHALQLLRFPILRQIPQAALNVHGEISLETPFSIAANSYSNLSNGPLSMIASGGVTLLDPDGASCLAVHYDQQRCAEHPLSRRQQDGADVLRHAPMAQYLFFHLFGWQEVDWLEVADLASVEAPNCDGLPMQGLLWIKGDCVIENRQVGTVNLPVILVVVDGDVRLGGLTEIFGLVILFNTNSQQHIFDLDMADGSVIHGAVVANQGLGQARGRYHVRYNGTILNNLKTGPRYTAISPITMSRRDFE